MAPSPCPDGVEVIVNQGASLDADHVHSRAVETVMVPVPPLAATDVAPARDIAQRVLLGPTTVLVDEPHADAASSAAHASANQPDNVRLDRRARSAVPFTAGGYARASPVFLSSVARISCRAQRLKLEQARSSCATPIPKSDGLPRVYAGPSFPTEGD